MQVFPQTYVFAHGGENQRKELQSTIILAIKSEEPPLFFSEDLALDSLLAKRVTEPKLLDAPILTDDFAPVDYLAFRGL